MSQPGGKVLVAQGGGPTAVINQSVVGVVLEARKHPQVTHIYGALHGVSGIINENFLDLTETSVSNLEAVAQTPSSALCSTRDKPDVVYCHKIFAVCQKYDIRYFFYCGGNDSADTCRILAEEAEKTGYPLNVVHVPKTIDNDLRVTDHCPGFGSAARYVAQAFAGAGLDNRAIPGVYIGIVMGRHAGFLTAASALGRKYPDDGPHLIYVPERAFSKKQFLDDVKAVYEKHGRCVIAVSEGICDAKGVAIAAQFTGGERDAHGNIQLSGTGALGDLIGAWVKESGITKRVRSDTFGYIQRSFLGCVSETDQREARDVGQLAVQYAVGQGKNGSVAIRRVGDYAVDYFLTPLHTVARVAREMPANYMNKAGNNVTEAFLKYAAPLAGPLPTYERIHAPVVKKRK